MPSLADRLATGDPSAFAELYDACADRLHGYLLFRLRHSDAADDVLQETFLRLVRTGRKLHQVEDVEGYIFRIAHNESQRWLARHRRHRSDALADIAADAETDTLENIEEADHLLSQLEGVSREILELKFFGGLTFAAIAAALRLPPGTVATHYRRALEKIRHGLEQKRP